MGNQISKEIAEIRTGGDASKEGATGYITQGNQVIHIKSTRFTRKNNSSTEIEHYSQQFYEQTVAEGEQLREYQRKLDKELQKYGNSGATRIQPRKGRGVRICHDFRAINQQV